MKPSNNLDLYFWVAEE